MTRSESVAIQADQLTYTSCRKGRGGSAGFQIRSASSGLNYEEEREISQRGAYHPPEDAPSQPTAEQLQRSFPVAFRSYRLGSGRLALTRSVYAGKDSSGRQGNYFAHTLVLDEELPAGTWPIDLFEWPGWKGPLKPTEDTEEIPPPLPKVALQTAPAAGSFSWKDLAEFLAEDSSRKTWLVEMARALFLSREDSRPLVIRAPMLDAPFWLACLQKILPSNLASRLSSSTYQGDSRGCADVNITCGVNRFSLGEINRQYRYYSFDLESREKSDVDAVDADGYIAHMIEALMEAPASLGHFYAWLDSFEVSTFESLPVALKGFRWLEAGGRLDEGTLESFLSFTKTIKDESRSRFLDELWRVAKSDDSLSAECLGLWARYFVGRAETEGMAIHCQRGVELWLRLVRLAAEGAEADLFLARQLWAEFDQTSPWVESAMVKQLLGSKPWREANDSVPRETFFHFLVELTWWTFARSTEDPVWERADVLQQMVRLVSNNTGRHLILRMACGVDGALKPVVLHLTSITGRMAEHRAVWRELGQSMAPFLSKAEAAEAMEIRRSLEDREAWDVLFGEWLGWLAGARNIRDRSRWENRYYREVLNELPLYARLARAWVASSLLEGLSEEDQRIKAMDWLSSGALEGFPAELQDRCLPLANENVHFRSPDNEMDEISKRLAALAERRELTLVPDRPFLRRVCSLVREEELDLGHLGRVAGERGELDVHEIESFLDGFLESALESCSSSRAHGQVLEAVVDERVWKRSAKRYWKLLRKSLSLRATSLALRFWLTRESHSDSLERFRKPAIRGLRSWLARLNDSDYRQLDRDLQRAKETRDQWLVWKKIVDSRRLGALARARGFLGRIRKALPTW